tara:strand:- start:799 stop:1002 length:204 start_codon:yes stop_codon:yes gene_type:complete
MSEAVLTNSTIFNKKPETILVNGLEQMTKACDAITKQNEILNNDILKLKSKLRRLQDKELANLEDKE